MTTLPFIAKESGGWDSQATLTFLANKSTWDTVINSVDDFISILNMVKSASGGWTSTATITFLAAAGGSVVSTLNSVDDFITVLNMVVAGSGGWATTATITFIGSATASQWSGVINSVDDFIAVLNLVKAGSGGWNSAATISFLASGATQWLANVATFDDFISTLNMIKAGSGAWESDAVMAFISNFDYSKSNLTWDEMQSMLELANIPESVIQTIKATMEVGLQDGAWSELQHLSTINSWLAYFFNNGIGVHGQVALAAYPETHTVSTAMHVIIDSMPAVSLNSAYLYGGMLKVYGVSPPVSSSTVLGDLWYQWINAGFPVDVKGDGYGTYATGGIASGPDSGYFATLHGTEAIIPLSQGYIPVRIMDGGSRRGETGEVEELLREQNRLLKERLERPINVTVEVGGKSFDAYIDRRADNVRVKAEERNVGARRLF
jgi:hypothetical protein